MKRVMDARVVGSVRMRVSRGWEECTSEMAKSETIQGRYVTGEGRDKIFSRH